MTHVNKEDISINPDSNFDELTRLERKHLYEMAVEKVERFQNQYSPKLTDYKDDVKTTIWDDPNGNRHHTHEEMQQGETQQMDDAWEIINDYEEHYITEYLDDICDANNEEKNVQSTEKDDQDALEAINAIRSANHQHNCNRLADFEKNTVDISLADIPIKTQITVLHPDGTTHIPVTNTLELNDALMALYSDGQGDFGQYDIPSEQYTPTNEIHSERDSDEKEFDADIDW